MAIEVFDQASGVVATPFKTSATAWTDAFAPELLLWLEELPAGVLLGSLGQLITGLIFGFGGLGALALSNVAGRDRAALEHMTAHWLTHPNAPGLYGLLNTASATPAALTANLAALKAGIAGSNLDLVRSAFMPSAQDIAGYFSSLSTQFSALMTPLALPGVAPAAVPVPPTVPAAPSGLPGTAERAVAGLASPAAYGQVF